MFQFKNIKAYSGPNIFSHEPVVVSELVLQSHDSSLLEAAIQEISNFSNKWFVWDKSYSDSDDLKFYLGSFIAAWSKAALSEVRGNIRVASVHEKEHSAFIILGFHDPSVTYRALEICRLLILDETKRSQSEFNKLLGGFWALCGKKHPDFQAQFLIDYAHKTGLPFIDYLGVHKHWQFGWGVNSLTFFESKSMDDSSIGGKLSGNKAVSKSMFHDIGAPVVKHAIADDEPSLREAAKKLGFPCVVKPLDSGRSKGVTSNIQNYQQLCAAYGEAKKYTDMPVMVEKHIEGQLHRVIVIRGKLWKVIKREQPFVLGDGEKTVFELTARFNQEINDSCTPGSFVGPVPINDEYHEMLHLQGLSSDSVPSSDEKVYLQKIPLLSKGAIYSDVTDKVHPEIAFMSETLSELFGIETCGLDYITEDVSVPSSQSSAAFIELNGCPGLRVPVMAGIDPSEIASALLGDKPARIPSILVVANKSEQLAIKEILPENESTGWLCCNKAGVGKIELSFTEVSVPQGIRSILVNKKVSSVVVVVDQEEIVNLGLPLDKIDHTILYGDDESLPHEWEEVIRANSAKVSLADDLKTLSCYLTGSC